MSRPGDWSALGLGRDPIPGDPGHVRDGGRDYLDVAIAIGDAVDALRSMELDGDESEAVETLITNAGDVADSISRAEERYRETAFALLEYAPRLASAQETSIEALHLAQSAQEDADEAEEKETRYLRLAEGEADEHKAIEYRDLARRAGGDADDAGAGLTHARNKLHDAIDERDRAARDAEDRIREIVDNDGLNDSWWDDWGADLVAVITDIAGWVSTIAGVLALCVSWIPVIGQALAGVLLIVAGVAAVINAIGNIALAATGERSWVEAGISIVGAVLSVVGLGAVARSLGKMASIARINRLAAKQPLGPYDELHLVSLNPRSVNRFSTAQIREAEAAWHAPIPQLDEGAKLYRLYGGPDSKLMGGSYGSVDPRTLRFPHNTLGLPGNNTMERMATFTVNPGSSPVLVRHALPYEGTLGGAPEYIFPGGNGLSVASDKVFTIP